MVSFSQLPAVKEDTIFGATRTFLGPSYFVTALVSLVLSSLALRSLSWGPARAQSAFLLNIAHSRVGRALV